MKNYNLTAVQYSCCNSRTFKGLAGRIFQNITRRKFGQEMKRLVHLSAGSWNNSYGIWSFNQAYQIIGSVHCLEPLHTELTLQIIITECVVSVNQVERLPHQMFGVHYISNFFTISLYIQASIDLSLSNDFHCNSKKITKNRNLKDFNKYAYYSKSYVQIYPPISLYKSFIHYK